MAAPRQLHRQPAHLRLACLLARTRTLHFSRTILELEHAFARICTQRPIRSPPLALIPARPPHRGRAADAQMHNESSQSQHGMKRRLQEVQGAGLDGARTSGSAPAQTGAAGAPVLPPYGKHLLPGSRGHSPSQDAWQAALFTAMPDASSAALYAVYDGHGLLGERAAAHCVATLPRSLADSVQQQLEAARQQKQQRHDAAAPRPRAEDVMEAALVAAFEQTDAQLMQRGTGSSGGSAAPDPMLGSGSAGSTATVALVTRESVFLAWAGARAQRMQRLPAAHVHGTACMRCACMRGSSARLSACTAGGWRRQSGRLSSRARERRKQLPRMQQRLHADSLRLLFLQVTRAPLCSRMTARCWRRRRSTRPAARMSRCVAQRSSSSSSRTPAPCACQQLRQQGGAAGE